MAHPNGEPVPVPDRVLLPAPDGRDPAGSKAFWRLPNGRWLQAGAGWVGGHHGSGHSSLDEIERHALVSLAAVRWARGQA